MCRKQVFVASRRSRAREMALQMLYQQDINPDAPSELVRQQIQERLPEEDLARFCWSLFVGVMEYRPELDVKIEATAANWALKRMAPTDRNVLRLGGFELLHTQTPPRVVIDEALELAKRYGTAQSAQFVNGILDRLIPSGGRGAVLDIVDEELPDAAEANIPLPEPPGPPDTESPPTPPPPGYIPEP